jgi:hypothetical protein
MRQVREQDFGSGAVMDVGWKHAVLQEISLRINEKMALATLSPPTVPAQIASRSNEIAAGSLPG